MPKPSKKPDKTKSKPSSKVVEKSTSKKKKTSPPPAEVKSSKSATKKKKRAPEPEPAPVAKKSKKSSDKKASVEKNAKALGAKKARKGEKAEQVAPTKRAAKKDPRKGKAEKKKQFAFVSAPVQIVFNPDFSETNKFDKYSATIAIPKEDWKGEEGKKWRKAVLGAAREYYKLPDLKLEDFNHPFKDGATTKYDFLRDHIMITVNASAEYPPEFVGRGGSDDKLSEKEIAKIRAGYYVRFALNAFGYDMTGNNGVSLGMNVVQLIQAGKPLGGGAAASLKAIDDAQIDFDDLQLPGAVDDDSDSDDDDDADDDDQDSGDEEADEDEDDSDDEEEDDDSDDESEDDDSDDSEDDDEESDDDEEDDADSDDDDDSDDDEDEEEDEEEEEDSDDDDDLPF